MAHLRNSFDAFALHWGKLDGKLIEVGVNDILNGDKGPVLRGSIVTVSDK